MDRQSIKKLKADLDYFKRNYEQAAASCKLWSDRTREGNEKLQLAELQITRLKALLSAMQSALKEATTALINLR